MEIIILVIKLKLILQLILKLKLILVPFNKPAILFSLHFNIRKQLNKTMAFAIASFVIWMCNYPYWN